MKIDIPVGIICQYFSAPLLRDKDLVTLNPLVNGKRLELLAIKPRAGLLFRRFQHKKNNSNYYE